ncbi:FGGY family carbohydrate kinase [Actinospongicola halichondriae]|uniref:FGGY family carbohydrate kinase n=1 Tax=Actinospongicola halichondriae TaxID=3236844 RepID=UPI003D39B467
MSVLVIDVGTSSVRALVVGDDGRTSHEQHVETLPTSPHPGLVEFDATAIATAAIGLAAQVVSMAGTVDAVGVTNQRASTVLWDARTGQPIGPGLGWQDLRTVGRCLELRAEGIAVAPNMTATKAEWLLQQTDVPRTHLRLGTVDTWVVWHLSGGMCHVTDATNAAVTGLYDVATGDWDGELLERLDVPRDALPSVVDTIGSVGAATAIVGTPPVTAVVGDQQASLVGQGCIEPGHAKITFGTGAMLDLCLDAPPPATTPAGTFPIVTWQQHGRPSFGLEAVMLAAGSAVEWLRDGLGIIDSAASSADIAATVDDAGGVVFVPSLSGTGTPDWDHGARGLLIGMTRGSTRAHVVRAVLEGVAHRGADLVEAVEAATGHVVDRVRIDGGMSRNPIFVQALANTTGRAIDVSTEREATALGAGLLAGTGVGMWPDLAAAVGSRPAATVVEPSRTLDRERFREARARAGHWIPALSDLDL